MVQTLRLDANLPADMERAAALLHKAGTVAFPTETVYGLGANALDELAVTKIFAAKQRPAWDPLIVHLAEKTQLGAITELGAELTARVDLLVQTFWPGPLTLLLPRASIVPDAVTAGRPLVGVRVPAHPVAHALLSAAGVPVAAPSANTFGHTSPTTAAHVIADLDSHIDAVLDGGTTIVGVESTVLDPATMTIYRPGAVTGEMIASALGMAVSFFEPATFENGQPEALPSPGVGIRHYAPRARVLLTEGTEQALIDAVTAAYTEHGERAGVLLPLGWELEAQVLVEPWAAWGDEAALATRLFGLMRSLDDRGAAIIVCPLPPSGGLNDAIRDRLEKAARAK